jgi:RNA polymerase sigma factor (sigma-70 family)
MDTAYTAAGFPPTEWRVIMTARARETAAGSAALGSLCSAYWRPLYTFIQRQGALPQEAEDLTQEFLYRFVERRGLDQVKPEAGKFRSYLLACLKHFLAHEREKAQAQRRGGGKTIIPLCVDDEDQANLEPADLLTPDKVFEQCWAQAVVQRTRSALRHEYDSPARRVVFDALQDFLPGGHGSVSKAALAERLKVSVGAIDVAIHRLRQRFAALFREQVARTVSSPTEVDEEIQYLISVLAS